MDGRMTEHPLVQEFEAMLPAYIWESLNPYMDTTPDDTVEVELVACDQKEVLSFVGSYPVGKQKLAIIQGQGACEGVDCVLFPGEVAKNISAVNLMIFQAFRVARLEMQQRHEIYLNAARIALQSGAEDEARRMLLGVKNEPNLTWRERVELLRIYEERAK